MNALKKYFIFLTWTIVMISCKKDSNETLTGTYVGTFTAKYPNGPVSGNTTVILKDNGQYFCYGNPNFVPAGGKGAFSRANTKLIFSDSSVWTANFDWNCVLHGEYDYTFDGTTLKISAYKNNVGSYEYNLIKQ